MHDVFQVVEFAEVHGLEHRSDDRIVALNVIVVVAALGPEPLCGRGGRCNHDHDVVLSLCWDCTPRLLPEGSQHSSPPAFHFRLHDQLETTAEDG